MQLSEQKDFICTFYEKSFKSLKIHCFICMKFLTKNYKLVIILATLVQF